MFIISNAASGHTFGEYEGVSAEQALDLFARDAGYADYAEACEIASGDDVVAVWAEA